MWKSPPYKAALDLQRLIMDAAKKPDCKGSDLAQLARAWDALEERKRILRMKPKPKDVAVELVKVARKKATPRLTEPGDATSPAGAEAPDPDLPPEP